MYRAMHDNSLTKDQPTRVCACHYAAHSWNDGRHILKRSVRTFMMKCIKMKLRVICCVCIVKTLYLIAIN